jgi:hypothetical protein
LDAKRLGKRTNKRRVAFEAFVDYCPSYVWVGRSSAGAEAVQKAVRSAIRSAAWMQSSLGLASEY